MIEGHYKCLPGSCTKAIDYKVDEETGYLFDIHLDGGCNGMGAGIKALILGKNIHDIIAQLKEVKCKGHPYSCPQQIAMALQGVVVGGVI
jgi:uncharacterized protein (TIGR03905 family)